MPSVSSRSRFVFVGVAALLFIGGFVAVSISLLPILPALPAVVVDYAPVVRVEGQFVSFASFRHRAERNIVLWREQLPAQQAALRAEQAALQELIGERVVTALLEDAGGSVSDTDVDTQYWRMALLAGGPAAFRSELEGYGWDETTFKAETVRPAAELSALQQVFFQESPIASLPAETDARRRAEAVQEELVDGTSFEEMADLLRSDGSAQAFPSELGWTVLTQMDEWFQEALAGAEVGSVVGPVRSPAGYHVFLVQGARGDDANHELLLSEILFSVPDAFTPWLESRLRSVEVSIYLPGFQWKDGKVVLTETNP